LGFCVGVVGPGPQRIPCARFCGVGVGIAGRSSSRPREQRLSWLQSTTIPPQQRLRTVSLYELQSLPEPELLSPFPIPVLCSSRETVLRVLG
jgi:hypothetical protein